MANDFDELMSELPGGENRLADLFRQVTASLAAVAERTRRLGDLFQAVAPPGAGWRPGGSAWPRPGLEDAAGAGGLGSSQGGVPTTAAGTPLGRDQDKVAADNARANQQTAKAIEEILRNGIKLQDVPPAVYSE